MSQYIGIYELQIVKPTSKVADVVIVDLFKFTFSPFIKDFNIVICDDDNKRMSYVIVGATLKTNRMSEFSVLYYTYLLIRAQLNDLWQK